MLFEGLRSGEARAFRHCDIKDGYIEVSRSIADTGEECKTKTGNIRQIPIFNKVKEDLEKLKSSSEERIFKNSNKNTGQKEFNTIIKSLGLDYRLYELRHTFGSRCSEAGIATKQIALWMGHSDTETTLKYYTHVNKDFELSNIEKMNDFHTS